jgi:hypothetical protein
MKSEVKTKLFPETETLEKQIGLDIFAEDAKYFNPKVYRSYFERGVSLINRLKQIDSTLFADISQDIPEPHASTDFEGLGYYVKSDFQPLMNNLERIIALIKANINTGNDASPEIDSLMDEIRGIKDSPCLTLQEEFKRVQGYRIQVIGIVERYCGRESQLLKSISVQVSINAGMDSMAIELIRMQYDKWLVALSEAKKYPSIVGDKKAAVRLLWTGFKEWVSLKLSKYWPYTIIVAILLILCLTGVIRPTGVRFAGVNFERASSGSQSMGVGVSSATLKKSASHNK